MNCGARAALEGPRHGIVIDIGTLPAAAGAAVGSAGATGVPGADDPPPPPPHAASTRVEITAKMRAFMSSPLLDGDGDGARARHALQRRRPEGAAGIVGRRVGETGRVRCVR